jgi:hypothetical protein
MKKPLTNARRNLAEWKRLRRRRFVEKTGRWVGHLFGVVALFWRAVVEGFRNSK